MAVTLDRPEGRVTNPAREWWGYGVWLFVGAVIATSELWAVAGNPWWPTISATVGHLEQLWSPVKIIVVALIAAAAAQMITYPPYRGEFGLDGRPARRWRTAGGRLTKTPGEQAEPIEHAGWYFPAAVVVIAGAAATAASLSSSKLVIGYVLYGLIAVAFLVIPNVLAFWFAKDVPFPTLFRTLADLDRRWHPAVLVIVAGLSVLAIHLVDYPWP
jgi:hypothetical protein